MHRPALNANKERFPDEFGTGAHHLEHSDLYKNFRKVSKLDTRMRKNTPFCKVCIFYDFHRNRKSSSKTHNISFTMLLYNIKTVPSERPPKLDSFTAVLVYYVADALSY